ncbi:MAG: Endoribonuclease EndoA [Enterocloster aldenensis]
MENDFHGFHRGEIYFADLDPVRGHEQGGVRPVLILQNDVGNYYSPTVIVTVASRRTFKKPAQPTHVVLDDAEGLDPSMFMLEVIRTIDKRWVHNYVGKLTEEQMERIDAALRVSLQLDEDAFLPVEMEAP